MSDEATTPTPATPAAPAAPAAPAKETLSNAAIAQEMAELGDELNGITPAKVAAKAKGEPAPKAEEKKADGDEDGNGSAEGTGADVSGEPSDVDGDEASDDVDAAGDEPREDEPTADPEAAKRIAAIQKAAKRSEEQLEQRRQQAERDFDDKRRAFESEWKPKLDLYQKQKTLLDKGDVLSLADTLDWDDDTKLHQAEQLYLSVKGKNDPKLREKYETLRRQREANSELSTVKKELAELKESLAKQVDDQAFDLHYSQLTSSVNGEHPTVAKLMKAYPEQVKSRARLVRDQLKKETGTNPSPGQVLKILEEHEVSYLKALGYDVTPKKAAPPPTDGTKPKPTKPASTQTAKPMNGTTTKTPQAPPPGPVTKEQLVKELMEMDKN